MAGNGPGLIEEAIELARRLPWWGSILAAMAFYLVLHPIAGLPLPAADGSTSISFAAVGQILIWVARISQYAVPALLLAAAGVSAFFASRSGGPTASMVGDPKEDRTSHREPSRRTQGVGSGGRRFGGRLEMGRAEPWISVADGQGRIPPSEQEDHEGRLGRDLSALIRSQELELDTPQLAPASQQAPTETPPGRIRVGRALDAVGMILALALAWLGYQSIAALPNRTNDSPWAHMGTARTTGDSSQASSAVPKDSDAAATSSARPLGQFDFGPAYVPNIPATRTGPQEEQASRQQPKGVAPVDQDLTIRELEAAFNANYIPPPECNDWASRAQMVSCGNHRMRALRAFVQGGGKMNQAMLGGPIELEPGAEQAGQRSDARRSSQQRPDDWREEARRLDQWGQPVGPRPGRQQGWSPDTPGTYSHRVRPMQRAGGPSSYRQPLTWRQEQARRDRPGAEGDPDSAEQQDWRLRYRRDSQADWRADGGQSAHSVPDW
jgi:hypothetical protein